MRCLVVLGRGGEMGRNVMTDLLFSCFLENVLFLKEREVYD